MILADKTYMGWVEGIDKGVTRMREVVETMLDVARIDNQALKLHLTPVALPQFIQQVANQFRDSLAARQLTLTVTPMPDLAAVAADAEALAKVFHHPLVNAIKYTPDGGEIVINGRSALLNVNGARQDGVEITITDTGIGIAPEVQELIFEKFYQTDAVKLHSSGKTKFKGAALV
ncbi:MAG: HAMP domain-containing histidine kinase [Chloroflexi bacterium]|nr:HAMP domain-containing histidine kinase [Chloroflexota bacterium]